MNIIRKISILVFILAFAVSAYAESGRDVMKKQEELQSLPTEYSYEKMVLIDSDGEKEQRALSRRTKDVGGGLHKALLVFLDPADVKGTALLTWEQKDTDDDQWLFMPDLGKMQRIAKGSKKNYFMGTDFTYEDMSSEELDNFVYTIVKSEDIKGVAHWVIESVPVESYKAETSYSKRVLWIQKDIYVTTKIDFYGRGGELVKTQVSADFKNIKGTAYRAQKILMDNKQESHKTFVQTVKIDADSAINDDVFSERFILNGLHTQN